MSPNLIVTRDPGGEAALLHDPRSGHPHPHPAYLEIMRVYLYFVGKPRDLHARAMSEEYVKRTNRYFFCEMREVNPAKFDPWARHPAALKVLLDAAGRTLDSAAFIEFVANAEMQGRDLVFLIGGFEGPPPDWKPRADLLLSLSAMTFPHEFARVMLAEQIYRAATTMRGHPYPR